MSNTTTPHSISAPITDFGAVGEANDGALTHASDTPNVAGNYLNKAIADLIQLHAIEAQRHTVVAHTSTYSFLDTDHEKIHTSVGASGGSNLREWTLPTPSPGFHKFNCYDADGVGIRLRARTGHTIRCGSLVSSSAGYIETLPAQKSYLVIVAISATVWLVLPTSDSLTPG